jgi:hypothetical protein
MLKFDVSTYDLKDSHRFFGSDTAKAVQLTEGDGWAQDWYQTSEGVWYPDTDKDLPPVAVTVEPTGQYASIHTTNGVVDDLTDTLIAEVADLVCVVGAPIDTVLYMATVMMWDDHVGVESDKVMKAMKQWMED